MSKQTSPSTARTAAAIASIGAAPALTAAVFAASQTPRQEVRAVPQADLDALDQARELERLESEGGIPYEAKFPLATAPSAAPVYSAEHSGADYAEQGEDVTKVGPVTLPRFLDDARQTLLDAAIQGLSERVASRKLSVDDAKEELYKLLDGIMLDKNGTTGDVLDEDELDETVLMDVYDEASDDFIQKEISRREYLQITEPVDPTALDPFALGVAYEKGDEARFDHSWGSTTDDGIRRYRADGWVPVKQSLDKQHVVAEGAVVWGDLVLLRRPKALRSKYDEQLRARQESMTGSIEGDLDSVKDSRAKGFTEGYQVDAGEQRRMEQRIAEKRAEEADKAKSKAKGKKQFYFENNPLYNNRVRAARTAIAG